MRISIGARPEVHLIGLVAAVLNSFNGKSSIRSAESLPRPVDIRDAFWCELRRAAVHRKEF